MIKPPKNPPTHFILNFHNCISPSFSLFATQQNFVSSVLPFESHHNYHKMKLKSFKLKLKEDQQPRIIKKQRTKTSRRLRSHISPVLISDLIQHFPQKSDGLPSLQGEVSCNSSRVVIESNSRKRKLSESDEKQRSEDLQLRRITRSYSKLRQNEAKVNEVELSESSCVESNFGFDCAVSGNRSTKLKKRIENLKDNELTGASVSVNESEISSVDRSALSDCRGLEKVPAEINDEDVSVASVVDSCFSHRPEKEKKRANGVEFSEILKNNAVSIDESAVEPKQSSLKIEADLSCAEQFSFDGAVSENSSSPGTELSEWQSELFADCSSELEFSDYTPSIFLDSGSEFSEKSADDPPSRAYSFLLEYRQQFLRSTVSLDMKRSLLAEAECLEHFKSVKFVDVDDEESYQMLRERERRQLYLHDYVDLYRSTTDYGDLIFQQRLKMVHWIIEQSTAKESHHETLFLGVSLLDRFLGKGYFNNKRNLQIIGIACLSLATRIEENQPFNSVRQKSFRIEGNVYSRCEVVAMEWLVQEVLSFKCFLPTIHTFMWFYLKAAKADAKLEKRARYLAKLALSDFEHLRHWPSTVAASLVILASLESDQIASYQRVIEVHIRTNENDLHECIKALEWLLQYVS